MAKTTTRTQQQTTDNIAKPAQAVAVLEPPRLQYAPTIGTQFGVDESQWRALIDAVFPAAKTTAAVVLALSYCKARKLDPFKRNVHIVPIYNREKKGWIETVWPGIAEHRTTASRTRAFAGLDKPTFGPTIESTFGGGRYQDDDTGEWKDGTPVKIRHPEWCELTVYRFVQGERVAFHGPRTVWREFYTRKTRFSDIPNDQWAKRPSQMIEKCAEAGALRRAFPEEIGDEATHEEIGAFGDNAVLDLEPSEHRVVPEEKPTRDKAKPAAAEATDAPAKVSDSEGKGGEAVVNAWEIGPDFVGQESKLREFDRLLAKTELPVDVDLLVEANRPFLNRLGDAIKATTRKKADDRKLTLQQQADKAASEPANA